MANIRQKILVAPGQPPKDAELIKVTKSDEQWSEFHLEDGAVLRLRPVMTAVWRLVDEYDPQGQPTYVTQLAVVNSAIVPDNLKKKIHS